MNIFKKIWDLVMNPNINPLKNINNTLIKNKDKEIILKILKYFKKLILYFIN